MKEPSLGHNNAAVAGFRGCVIFCRARTGTGTGIGCGSGSGSGSGAGAGAGAGAGSGSLLVAGIVLRALVERLLTGKNGVVPRDTWGGLRATGGVPRGLVAGLRGSGGAVVVRPAGRPIGSAIRAASDAGDAAAAATAPPDRNIPNRDDRVSLSWSSLIWVDARVGEGWLNFAVEAGGCAA